MRSIGPDVPTYRIFPMQELVDRSTAQRRFIMYLLAGFAGCALLLAVVGVYGMVSEAVAQRTREIGVRMALGASPQAALALVFRDGAALVGGGILLGAAGAAALTRLMTKLLFGVQPARPAVVRGGGAGARDVRGGCVLHPGEAGDTGRSAGRAAVGVNRCRTRFPVNLIACPPGLPESLRLLSPPPSGFPPRRSAYGSPDCAAARASWCR